MHGKKPVRRVLPDDDLKDIPLAPFEEPSFVFGSQSSSE
jgi:hypothetical protein